MDIIVARFAKDVSWTNQFKNSRIFVYDKSSDKNDYIKLPNIGRESHTFLYHIIKNYDDMSDYLCFLQDNPFDHIRNDIKSNGLQFFIESFDKTMEFKSIPKHIWAYQANWENIDEYKHIDYLDDSNMFDFYPLGVYFNCDLNGNPCNPEWYLKTTIFDMFFIDCPVQNKVFFTPGGQFIVSKSAIHVRKKIFYEKILEEFNRIDEEMYFKLHPVYTGHQKMAWVLEAVWAYLFNKHFKSKYDN